MSKQEQIKVCSNRVILLSNLVFSVTLPLMSALFLQLFACSYAAPQGRDQSQEGISHPLEIRVFNPLRWEKGCLNVSVERVNRSSAPLFLPVMGLNVSTSVNQSGDKARRSEEQEWINVYGTSDLVSWDATPIAPGSTVRDEHCLAPSVAVVHLQKKTRREIPLRGKLKIDAYYFLTEKDWLKNKSQREEMTSMPSKQRKKVARQEPQSITIILTIPCHEGTCISGCSIPPLIIQGENRVVPDVFDSPDWERRGRAVSEQLEHKSPSCSETISTLH
jgi:hypothetical protein